MGVRSWHQRPGEGKPETAGQRGLASSRDRSHSGELGDRRQQSRETRDAATTEQEPERQGAAWAELDTQAALLDPRTPRETQ